MKTLIEIMEIPTMIVLGIFMAIPLVVFYILFKK